MPISDNSIGSEKSVFFTDKFKVLVRSQKELLVRQAQVVPLIEPQVVNAFKNDFYRLIRFYGVPSYLWWATAYINGIENPTQDISGITSYLAINENLLASSIARSNTVRG